MPRYYKRVLLLGKRETVYGTDIVPAAADAAVAYDLQLSPLDGRQVQLRPAAPYFRGAETRQATKFGRLQGWIELAGRGITPPSTPPGYAWLLRAGGLAETINSTGGQEKVEYAPASPPYDSASVYHFLDGGRQRLLGCRAQLTAEFEAGDVPKLRFDLMGLHTDPSDVAFPTPDFSAFKAALPVNKANTPTFAFLGFSGALRRLLLNCGQAVTHNDMPGAEEVRIGDRAAQGSLALELPLNAAKNFVAECGTNASGALQVIHGTAAGAIVQLDCAKVKPKSPRYTEAEGAALVEMEFDVLPTAGDDEFKLTIK